MNYYLTKIIMFVKIIIVFCILGTRSTLPSKEYAVVNTNKDKTVELEHYYIDYNIIEKINANLPLFTTNILTHGVKGIKAIASNSQEPILIRESEEKIVEIGRGNPGAFVGNLTGYGPDCVGCIGIVACRPFPNVTNGNIYFDDSEFGTVYIIAADRSIPCGTIIEISNFNLSPEPIRAIVLDRGGVIKGKLIDLLFPTEEEAKIVGFQRNINYTILRWGR